jgi:hypothetical protein
MEYCQRRDETYSFSTLDPPFKPIPPKYHICVSLAAAAPSILPPGLSAYKTIILMTGLPLPFHPLQPTSSVKRVNTLSTRDKVPLVLRCFVSPHFIQNSWAYATVRGGEREKGNKKSETEDVRDIPPTLAKPKPPNIHNVVPLTQPKPSFCKYKEEVLRRLLLVEVKRKDVLGRVLPLVPVLLLTFNIAGLDLLTQLALGSLRRRFWA